MKALPVTRPVEEIKVGDRIAITVDGGKIGYRVDTVDTYPDGMIAVRWREHTGPWREGERSGTIHAKPGQHLELAPR